MIIVKMIEKKHAEKDKKIMAFAKARERFIKHGECRHDEQFQEEVKPHNCEIKIIQCSVCNKALETVYL
jgi:hypothetical protein